MTARMTKKEKTDTDDSDPFTYPHIYCYMLYGVYQGGKEEENDQRLGPMDHALFFTDLIDRGDNTADSRWVITFSRSILMAELIAGFHESRLHVMLVF